MAHNVLVVGELVDGAPAPTTLEMIGGATQLADGGEVGIVLLGSGASAAAAQATGAGKAYVNESAEFDEFRGDQWLPAIEEALDQSSADLVLIAQTVVGREIGPRLAHRRDTAVAMDCVRLEDEGGSIRVTRPAYGGNAHATYSFASSPAIATVRAKSFDPIEGGSGPSDTVQLSDPAPSRTSIVEREEAVAEGLQLTDAPVVVAGGRGLGAPEQFEMLEQLAATIGKEKAAVGASRAAVDLGWYPPSQQVGLTGKVVTPDLYIAVAISGASQHMAGCSGSKTIVAINRDREANIFGFAKYGIVGDYKQVVPALIEALKS
jgi:electron transfer flavoprotein alpha subunit